MSNMISMKYYYSKEIKDNRQNGDFTTAISLCLRAIEEYPDENFFYMILGDIYFQQQRFEVALKTYLEYLKRIDNNIAVRNFLKRYTRLKSVVPIEQLATFQQQAMEFLSTIKSESLKLIEDIFSEDFSFVQSIEETKQLQDILNKSNFNFNEFLAFLTKIETASKEKIEPLLDRVILNRTRVYKSLQAEKYSISLYEKLGQYEKAIQIAVSILEIQKDPVIIRTLFRLCRKLDDYTIADIFLSKYPEYLKSDNFNILYELVYYFESQNDQEQIINNLQRMERLFEQSLPINETLINFYLKYGMLERANIVRERISNLKKHKKQPSDAETRFSQAIKESEEGIWSKIQELYSELDHQKQLAAISELTTGISHELGQPITNIRYTIQFYREIIKQGEDMEIINKVFNSVLEETERMGNLIKRLSPLTSSKSLVQEFNVVQMIMKRINSEEARLKKENIKVYLKSKPDVSLVFDPVKFEQVISNLLLNSIYSLKEKQGPEDKVIKIRLNEYKDKITLTIEDTGKGVPLEARRKIFEPFFSTKPPGEGEGLGLFIIWNILKMQGGKITLDPSYTLGARFIIIIPR